MLDFRGLHAFAPLHDALAAAGLLLVSTGSMDITSNNDTLAQAIIDTYTAIEARVWMKARVEAIAKERRDAIVAPFSAGEMASWPIKRAEMLAYNTSGNAADAPVLSAEATVAGVPLADIVTRVQTNAGLMVAAEAGIAGHARALKNAIDAADLATLVAMDIEGGWPA